MYNVEELITSDGKYNDRIVSDEINDKKIRNAAILCCKLEDLFTELKISRREITSGFRTIEANKKAGGAPHSNHLDCNAVDLADADRSLYSLLEKNILLLEKLGLWVEIKDKVGRTHIQTVAVKNRFFKP